MYPVVCSAYFLHPQNNLPPRDFEAPITSSHTLLLKMGPTAKGGAK